MIKVFRPFWSYDVKKTEKWQSLCEIKPMDTLLRLPAR